MLNVCGKNLYLTFVGTELLVNSVACFIEKKIVL